MNIIYYRIRFILTAKFLILSHAATQHSHQLRLVFKRPFMCPQTELKGFEVTGGVLLCRTKQQVCKSYNG